MDAGRLGADDALLADMGCFHSISFHVALLRAVDFVGRVGSVMSASIQFARQRIRDDRQVVGIQAVSFLPRRLGGVE